MKKILILITFLLILTGCGKSMELVCTKKVTTDSNLIMNNKMEVTYKDDKVTEVTQTIETDLSQTNYNSEDFIDKLIESSKEEVKALNDLSGISAKYEKINNGYRYILKINYKDLDEEKIKDKVNSLYGKKEYTLDEFREAFLKDYDCK